LIESARTPPPRRKRQGDDGRVVLELSRPTPTLGSQSAEKRPEARAPAEFQRKQKAPHALIVEESGTRLAEDPLASATRPT